MSVFLFGRHVLDESSFWGQSFSWVSDVMFELASLLSGEGIPIRFLITCLSFSLPVERHFS